MRTTTASRWIPFLAIGSAAVLLAACSSSAKPSDTTAAQSTLPPVRAVSLTITVGTTDEPTIDTSTLQVAEDGTVSGTGSLADPSRAAAAAALLDNPAVVKRLVEGAPSGQMCTAIYGGPDIATVTGTLRGEAVDQKFGRSDGCAIADWELFAPMFGRSHWDGERRVYQRDETSITVATGTSFTIELDSNATTGYQWTLLPLTGSVVTAGDHSYINPTGGAVGSGGWERFVFTAGSAGSATITLEYRRPFEPASTPAIDTVTYSVTVTG